MIKFDNKLELRYYFNDKSNYMDAMIKHRSEKEVLSLVRTLADMLDIKMTVYCESFAQQEGFREIWSVATGCGPFGGRRGKDAARNCLIA